MRRWTGRSCSACPRSRSSPISASATTRSTRPGPASMAWSSPTRPDVLTEEVADTALGLLLMTIRELPQAERWLRAGHWTAKGPYPLTHNTLRDKTVGILALGRIGKAIAKRLRGVRVTVVYHGRNAQKDVALPLLCQPRRDGGDVDILLSVAPGGPDTYHVINAEVLKALGPQGMLINIGRGSVVDEAALIEALKNKAIFSAGLDVFEHEPQVPAELIAMEHVVLLPHVGSASAPHPPPHGAARGGQPDLVVLRQGADHTGARDSLAQNVLGNAANHTRLSDFECTARLLFDKATAKGRARRSCTVPGGVMYKAAGMPDRLVGWFGAKASLARPSRFTPSLAMLVRAIPVLLAASLACWTTTCPGTDGEAGGSCVDGPRCGLALADPWPARRRLGAHEPQGLPQVPAHSRRRQRRAGGHVLGAPPACRVAIATYWSGHGLDHRPGQARSASRRRRARASPTSRPTGRPFSFTATPAAHDHRSPWAHPNQGTDRATAARPERHRARARRRTGPPAAAADAPVRTLRRRPATRTSRSARSN